MSAIDPASAAGPATGVARTALADGALRRSLGTGRLVIFVIAAVAPLAAVIGVLPVALVYGSGAALPLAFAIVSVVVGLFAVGYSAISREIVVGGAFYTYIARGLGPVIGLGAACVAVVSYTAFVPGGLSYLGFVMHTALLDIFGVDLGWMWFSLGAWAIVACLGYRQLDVSSKLVFVLILLEFLLLLTLDIGVFSRLGAKAFPSEALNLGALTRGAPGVSLLLAFTCYFGVESAALYSEESVAPEQSVSRATYIAIAFIGLFYYFTSWITVGAVGPDNIRHISTDEVGTIYFTMSDRYLNRLFTHVIQLALVTSMFATVLSIHNVAARYLFVLGRQKCMPGWLGSVHSKHGSPYLASLVVSAVSLTIVSVCGTLKIHPMVGLGMVALGFAAVGILFMQVLTSIAVIAYFRRSADRSLWAHVLAPALSCVGLATGLAVSLNNFQYLSGSENRFVNALPLGVLVALLAGMGYALWLRQHRQARYATLLID